MGINIHPICIEVFKGFSTFRRVCQSKVVLMNATWHTGTFNAQYGRVFSVIRLCSLHVVLCHRACYILYLPSIIYINVKDSCKKVTSSIRRKGANNFCQRKIHFCMAWSRSACADQLKTFHT